jgi:hypothetical protein
MSPERTRRVREGQRDQDENAGVCWNASGRNSFRIGGHCVQRHGRAFGTYQSHYNTKLNRCLMLTTDLHALQDDNVEVVTLVDANERRKYATYQEMQSHEAVAKDLQTGTKTSGKVLSCKLAPSIRHETTCKNREEFEAFVAKYMEE